MPKNGSGQVFVHAQLAQMCTVPCLIALHPYSNISNVHFVLGAYMPLSRPTPQPFQCLVLKQLEHKDEDLCTANLVTETSLCKHVYITIH